MKLCYFSIVYFFREAEWRKYKFIFHSYPIIFQKTGISLGFEREKIDFWKSDFVRFFQKYFFILFCATFRREPQTHFTFFSPLILWDSCVYFLYFYMASGKSPVLPVWAEGRRFLFSESAVPCAGKAVARRIYMEKYPVNRRKWVKNQKFLILHFTNDVLCIILIVV